MGIAEYHDLGDRLLFPHTEIEPSRRGQGLGDQLIKGALDDVRRLGRTVVASCWAVSDYITDHPEYADLVALTATRPADFGSARGLGTFPDEALEQRPVADDRDEQVFGRRRPRRS